MASEATDGNTAQVGPEIAERLGISQLTYIERFGIDEDSVEASRMLEGGREKVRVKLPALLTITNTANEPRYPTFGGILKATKQTVTAWGVSDVDIDENKVGLGGSPTKIRKIDRAVSQRSKYMVEGCSCGDSLDILLTKLQRRWCTVRIGENLWHKNITEYGFSQNHQPEKINKSTLELIAKGRELAGKLGVDLSVVLAGYEVNQFADNG